VEPVLIWRDSCGFSESQRIIFRSFKRVWFFILLNNFILLFRDDQLIKDLDDLLENLKNFFVEKYVQTIK
jgi:hypothetical protein